MPADTSRIIRKLLGLLWFAPLLACSSSSTTTTTITSTFVTVRPSTFRGDVVCGNLPGAWRTYVATLIDVTDPEAPIRLASSRPVLCTMPVSFAWVIPEHHYIAEIEGYDRDIYSASTNPDAAVGATIVPLGGTSSGSSQMVDPKTDPKQDVAPRWKTTCGIVGTSTDGTKYPNATQSLYSTDVTVQDCAVLEELQAPTDSGLELDLAPMCATVKGQVDHLHVVPNDSAFAPVDAKCDEVLKFGPTQAGKNYKFEISAFEADSSAATWASHCETTAQASVTLPIACSTLSSAGALRIDMAALLAKAKHSCGTTDVLQYRASLVGAGKPASLLSCSADAVFSSLSPNSYDVMVDAFDVKSQGVFSAFCKGATIPGQVTTASCQVSPP